jgi:hypothetical protein
MDDIHTYIPLTLYPRRGSKGISDIPPRHPQRWMKYVKKDMIKEVSIERTSNRRK